MKINQKISDIYIWDKNYIFAALSDGFVLINVKYKEIEKKFPVEFGEEINILKHETKGDYLFFISKTGKLDLYSLDY